MNHDLGDLEEFYIIVDLSSKDGRVTKQVFFPQYPDRTEIAGRVASIGCERNDE